VREGGREGGREGRREREREGECIILFSIFFVPQRYLRSVE
jgi:hypothetical protein